MPMTRGEGAARYAIRYSETAGIGGTGWGAQRVTMGHVAISCKFTTMIREIALRRGDPRCLAAGDLERLFNKRFRPMGLCGRLGEQERASQSPDFGLPPAFGPRINAPLSIVKNL